MKKKVLRRDVGEEKKFNTKIYGDTRTDINEIIDFFVKAKKAGATHVEWYAKNDYDGDSEYCQAQPFYEYEETEEEAEKRMKNEADNVKRQLEESQRREKVEYERLKAKFG